MRRLKTCALLFFAAVVLCVAFVGSAFNVAAKYTEVYLGGMPAGFTLSMGGAQIVGMCEVLTEGGVVCPAKKAELAVGDIICSLNGMKISSAADIDKALAAAGEKTEIAYERDGKNMRATISPATDIASGRRKLGVLIRDSISGIGTVTYIQKETLRFGSLGHAVANENGELFGANNGNIFRCSIVGVVRGERGRAGELKGLFLNDSRVATADKNCDTGIYGTFADGYDFSKLNSVEIGTEARPGRASIMTTVDGTTPKEYEVGIIKVDSGNKQNKNFVIKVTDESLLEITGGIVQGMSGSPILQDGKLIGAITHVFLNDPTRGYGIAIENMLSN